MKRCLIIGGGIAGLTAASILSSKKNPVTLIESSPKLGGRTYSFFDSETNSVVDNGQHIMMGCYKDTLAFINLIGAENNFVYQKNLALEFLDKTKKQFTLNSDKYFYPLNLVYSITKYDALTLIDKLSFIGFILKLPFISKKSLINKNVFDWLTQQNQNLNLISKFWEILCVGALNTSLEKASAFIFYDILLEIFFKGNFSSTIILPKYGLSESLINPAAGFIMNNGGKIILSETVKEIVIENRKVKSLKTDCNNYEDFDFVISALPLYALEKILPAKNLGIAINLEYSTILNVHLWVENINLKKSFYGFLGSTLHWVFIKNDHINIVISNADYLADKSKEEILDFVLLELKEFVNIDNTNLKHYKIIKEKRATFIPSKEIINTRPDSKTLIENLFLAGDWINTGLPSTIESAVRSGRIAAEFILKSR